MSAEYVEINDLCDMGLLNTKLRPNDGAGSTPIEPGTYDFEIIKQVSGQSPAGSQTLKITAKVIGPENSPMLNKAMTQTYVIKDPTGVVPQWAAERMLNFVQAANIPLDAQGRFSKEALVGAVFTADVRKEPGKSMDKFGNEVEKDWTKWVGERACDAGYVSAPSAPAPAPTPAPAPAAAAAPRRPATAPAGRPQAPRG